MRRPCHRIERAAFAASPKILCELLQHRENPPLIGQRCADLAPGSADRSHRVACPGRGASSPVRPNLTFQYTQLRSLRVSKLKTTILILSGLAGVEDKVRGLGFGADDYMTKPFHKRELLARIHAIVRRSRGHAHSVIETGDLVVNLDTKTVEVNGARVHLTGKEYQMLELLSLRKGTTLTKEMFLNHLYGGMDEPEIKIIDVFMCKLRKKLAHASNGKDYFETVWGRGYVLREPSEAFH